MEFKNALYIECDSNFSRERVPQRVQFRLPHLILKTHMETGSKAKQCNLAEQVDFGPNNNSGIGARNQLGLGAQDSAPLEQSERKHGHKKRSKKHLWKKKKYRYFERPSFDPYACLLYFQDKYERSHCNDSCLHFHVEQFMRHTIQVLFDCRWFAAREGNSFDRLLPA